MKRKISNRFLEKHGMHTDNATDWIAVYDTHTGEQTGGAINPAALAGMKVRSQFFNRNDVEVILYQAKAYRLYIHQTNTAEGVSTGITYIGVSPLFETENEAKVWIAMLLRGYRPRINIDDLEDV